MSRRGFGSGTGSSSGPGFGSETKTDDKNKKQNKWIGKIVAMTLDKLKYRLSLMTLAPILKPMVMSQFFTGVKPTSKLNESVLMWVKNTFDEQQLGQKESAEVADDLVSLLQSIYLSVGDAITEEVKDKIDVAITDASNDVYTSVVGTKSATMAQLTVINETRVKPPKALPQLTQFMEGNYERIQNTIPQFTKELEHPNATTGYVFPSSDGGVVSEMFSNPNKELKAERNKLQGVVQVAVEEVITNPTFIKQHNEVTNWFNTLMENMRQFIIGNIDISDDYTFHTKKDVNIPPSIQMYYLEIEQKLLAYINNFNLTYSLPERLIVCNLYAINANYSISRVMLDTTIDNVTTILYKKSADYLLSNPKLLVPLSSIPRPDLSEVLVRNKISKTPDVVRTLSAAEQNLMKQYLYVGPPRPIPTDYNLENLLPDIDYRNTLEKIMSTQEQLNNRLNDVDTQLSNLTSVFDGTFGPVTSAEIIGDYVGDASAYEPETPAPSGGGVHLGGGGHVRSHTISDKLARLFDTRYASWSLPVGMV